MIQINKKYFAYEGIFKLMSTKEYYLDVTIHGKSQGFHLFIGNIYISIYIRLGK